MKPETRQTPFHLCRPMTGLGRFAKNCKFAKMCHNCCNTRSLCFARFVSLIRQSLPSKPQTSKEVSSDAPALQKFRDHTPRARSFEQHKLGICKLPDVIDVPWIIVRCATFHGLHNLSFYIFNYYYPQIAYITSETTTLCVKLRIKVVLG
jgi:hypothetical protein